MALSFQTSTLSLTLPISCQICLGKVKKPVICANYHVFCSSCMEMWLKKASQCPTCRVPITTDNPCREIIGGTNESDHNDGPSMKKCLRKTRGELLLREYEDEIEGLIKENEELKTKNLSLESQLKIALDPASIDAVQTNDKKVDSRVLEEWANKLRVATECSEKVKQDMDKLKEANKALRSQNVDLLQENMRLKAEVASRSPQKFGRYTVAALEAKIQQYERDLDHLKRALERSDQYIEDLESRVRKPESRCLEVQETHENSNAETDAFTQQQKINMMLRSLSNSERGSICSNPEAEYRTFSRSHSFVFMPAANHREFNTEGHKKENLECTSADFLPTTPSSAFRSLTLRSPGIREKKVAFKPASYLRRLDFEECPSPDKSNSPTENQLSRLDKFSKGFPPNTDTGPSKSVFWGGWQRTDSTEPGPSTESSVKGVSYPLVGDKTDSFQMSSEASMDAAYLDKISELDSMMLDGESSSSRESQLSLTTSPPTGLDNTLVPEPQTCPDVLSSQLPCENIDDPVSSNEAPEASADESCFSLGPDRRSDAHVSDSMGHGGSAHTDEMSFDLLFDSVEENKVDPAGCLGRGSPDGHYVNLSASSSCSGNPVNTAKERYALNISQRTKRKSHSPFNTSSPTKLSKLT